MVWRGQQRSCPALPCPRCAVVSTESMSNVVVRCVRPSVRHSVDDRKATIDALSVTSHLRGHRTANSITLLSTFRRFRPRKQSNIDVLIRWFNLLVYRCLRWPIMTDMSTTGRDCTEVTVLQWRQLSTDTWPVVTWPTLVLREKTRCKRRATLMTSMFSAMPKCTYSGNLTRKVPGRYS